DAMGGFGAAAQAWGLTADEAAVFSAAGISVGADAGVVATGFNTFFQKMNNMDSQGKNFHDSLKLIGLSAEEIKKGRGKDSAQAIIDVLGQISNYDGDTQTKVLYDLFGSGQGVAMLGSMTQNIGLLKKQLSVVRDINSEGKKNYLGSMQKEFESVSSTTANDLLILRNNFVEIGIVIGTTLLPPIKELVSAIRPTILSFADWAKANPELVTQGLKVAGVVIGLRLGFLALNFATFGLISNGFKLFAGLQKGWGILKIGTGVVGKLAVVLKGALLGSIKLVGNAIVWLGRALLMNPIGLAITAIAGAAYLIYRYWEPIKAFFINIWDTVKAAFDGGIGEVSRLIIDWSPLGLFHKAFAGVMSWFGVDIPSSFTDFGSMMIGDFIDSALATWDSTKSFFGDVVSFIQNPFNALPTKMQTFGVD
ncbi:MAG: phage tail tape measure protein, partial [Wohlfahrtiimonas sp.]